MIHILVRRAQKSLSIGEVVVVGDREFSDGLFDEASLRTRLGTEVRYLP